MYTAIDESCGNVLVNFYTTKPKYLKIRQFFVQIYLKKSEKTAISQTVQSATLTGRQSEQLFFINLSFWKFIRKDPSQLQFH